MTDDEEWRDIPGYIGYYEVSSHGRVRSLDRIVPVRGPHQRHKRVKARILRRDRRQQFSLAMHGSKQMRDLAQLMQEVGFPVTRGRK
jgi:NUMOD4 motif